MTRKEAIKGSLDKWKRICNDAADMSEAERHCALCDKYGGDCKGTCPLHEGMGKGCSSGPWGKIRRITRDSHGFDYGAIGVLSKQKRWTELSVYCNEMRTTLQELYDAEN